MWRISLVSNIVIGDCDGWWSNLGNISTVFNGFVPYWNIFDTLPPGNFHTPFSKENSSVMWSPISWYIKCSPRLYFSGLQTYYKERRVFALTGNHIHMERTKLNSLNYAYFRSMPICVENWDVFTWNFIHLLECLLAQKLVV